MLHPIFLFALVFLTFGLLCIYIPINVFIIVNNTFDHPDLKNDPNWVFARRLFRSQENRKLADKYLKRIKRFGFILTSIGIIFYLFLFSNIYTGIIQFTLAKLYIQLILIASPFYFYFVFSERNDIVNSRIFKYHKYNSFKSGALFTTKTALLFLFLIILSFIIFDLINYFFRYLLT